MDTNYDFSGWATKNDVLCSDGRTIRKDAFAGCNGKIVPLVYNHSHDNPDNVLGHVLLENRPEGVYAYGKFNDNDSGVKAKELVRHGDIKSLSIFANKLKQTNGNVLHGIIREVSLVLAGANSGAFIDNVVMHDGTDDEAAYLYFADENLVINHSDDETDSNDEKGKEEQNVPEEKTIDDVMDSMTEEQRNLVYALLASVDEKYDYEYEELEEQEDENDNKDSSDDDGGKKEMKHNMFEGPNKSKEETLQHAEEMTAAILDAKKYGSMKEAFLAHGITDIDFMFPDAKTITNTPGFYGREVAWVDKFVGKAHKTPFSRIKSLYANITAEEARARGYIKGNKKVDEQFSMLKRITTPTTVYKKQKLERDDIIDIVDFSVVSWLKGEMRTMLDEEIGRAGLVGDGRLSSSDDKINALNIRPIWQDDEMYTINKVLEGVTTSSTSSEKADAFIDAVIASRKDYKGSGSPILFAPESVITDCLLLKDKNGRYIYSSEKELATTLRVSEIVGVEVMEGLTRTADAKTNTLMAIIVNPNDYTFGADKGGAVSFFEDFDIDYNAQKYLIEARCSGSLNKPKSAISVEIASA